MGGRWLVHAVKKDVEFKEFNCSVEFLLGGALKDPRQTLLCQSEFMHQGQLTGLGLHPWLTFVSPVFISIQINDDSSLPCAFTKCMNYTELLKKQKSPKWGAVLTEGQCQHDCFPITVRLTLPISSSDQKQET